MKTKMLVGVGVSAIAFALAAKEAVIMKVNGVDVPKSEFEYLYHKNSQQQMSPQPIEDYVELFKLYKLKVADARAEGLDTIASFRKEMEQYRHDLAAPYLTDSAYLNKLLDETFKRAQEEVESRHIMLFKTQDPAQNEVLRNRADSIQKELKNGADFEELVKKFSGDRSSNTKGGSMGFVPPMMLPYSFETAAYSLSEGEISDVVETTSGYHILKGGKRRPYEEVLASHILISSDSPEKDASAKHLIDSLYNVVKADPSQFADVARRFSDDQGSGAQGGKLGWFGHGKMVQEFDSVSFAIPDGSISEPFKTRFGYHIIYRQDHKTGRSMNDVKPRFMYLISTGQDYDRTKMIRDNQTRNLAKKNKGMLNEKTLNDMRADIAKTGLDSAFYLKWENASKDIASIGKKNYSIPDFIGYAGKPMMPNAAAAENIFTEMVDRYYNHILIEAEEDNLLLSKPEYSNLYREYVDGSLLYEVSVKKVWDKAAKDEEGLQNYFDQNRSKYRWTEPRAKGYLVQTTTDSVAELVKSRAAVLGRDSLVNTIRKEFPKEVSISRVLETKGSNAMIDNLVFGGPEAKPSSSRYTTYFILDPRVIIEPEELQDVKGLVTSDYQTQLQEAWENDLRRKYPVEVNEKVLKKVKPIEKK